MCTKGVKASVKLVLLCYLLVIIGGATAAYATTYYVSTSGNDNNAGTSGSPFRTIQKGVDTANAGDTIEVAAGTYREKVVFNSEDGGTPGAPVTLHGASGAIIDASNANADSLTWTLQSGYNGGVYRASLGYNTNCVFVNDKAILEVDWATASAGFSFTNMWWWERLFTYGMKNVSGYPDFELWGAIPVGWDGVRSLAMLRTTDNTLWVKCMPDGEGSTPLNISQQTVRVSSYDANAIRINGANDVIIDGFRLKYGYDSIMVVGNSMGVEIKNCVIRPCFNGIWLDDGASGVSIHNCEVATDKMEDKSTKDRADNIWHMNKSHLLNTANQDKWGIFVRDNDMGGYRIYDNYIHDIGVGISSGPCAEVNHNKVEKTYQDAIGGNQRNLKLHHNVLDDVLQFGRLFAPKEGPAYFYNNIMIAGPITQNGLVFYTEAAGFAPEAYFYNNTLTLSPDVAYLTQPGCVNQDFYHLNNCSDGGNSFANHHIYNNLFWGDRWLKVYRDSNNTPVEAMWDGDNNVYVLRGDTWQLSGGVWSIIDNPSATWLDNINTDPLNGQAYAQAQGIDLNAYWTTSSPGFTNFNNKDLSLTSSSPARGRGANLTSLFGALPGSPSTDCGALPYGTSMLNVPGTSGGALSAPVIAGITPTEGGSAGGTLVNMTGLSLTGASVSFGGTAATSVAINPAGTHLTCLSPAHAEGSVNVTVTTSYGTSNAVTFTYSGGGSATTLTPTADTLIAAGSPTTNYGTGNNMQIQNNGPSYSIESLVKFDLNSIGGSITSAKLRVYKNGSSSSLVVTASSCSNDNWTETGVNWSNRPTKGTAQATATAAAAGWYEWDITSYANAEYADDKALTVYLSDLTDYRNVWTQWWTKEYSDANLRPRLIVTTGSGGSAPTLSSINPSSGTTAGGTACTLTGTYLTGCSAVSFGGTAGTGIVVDSATQVRCTSPARSAGAISVTATTSYGTSNGVTFTYNAPAPTLSSISPSSGTTSGGTACTLAGTNLTGCSAVSFGGTAATGIVVDSASQVRCTSPAKSAGTYSVTATTPGGTSNGVNFTYSVSAPTLTSIAPTSGTTAGGTACTLTGTNLTGCSAVSFGCTAGTGIVVDSATQVRCASPAKSVGTYSVTATTSGGTSNGVNYTYTSGGTSYTNTLFTTHDSMVAATAPSTTYGGYDNMQVQKTGGTTDCDSYMKFDLSSCQGTTVTSAKLRLYKNGNSTSHVINAFSCSDDSWLESTLCWNNRAAKGTSQASLSVQNTGWYEWNITSYVNTEFTGNKVVTVIMSEENNLNIWTQWWTKEKSATTYDPRLVVISQ